MRKNIQEIVPDIVYRNDDGQIIVADCKTQWGQTNHTTDLRLGTSSLTQTANRTLTSYNRRHQHNKAAIRECLYTAPRNIEQDKNSPHHSPPETCTAAEESPSSESTITLGFTVAPLVVGIWGEVNAPVLQVIDDAAKAGLDQFFPTITTMSQKIAQAQLSALMARRLGVAMTAARADAYLRALAERGDPHKPYFRHMAPLAQPCVQHTLKPCRDRCIMAPAENADAPRSSNATAPTANAIT